MKIPAKDKKTPLTNKKPSVSKKFRASEFTGAIFFSSVLFNSSSGASAISISSAHRLRYVDMISIGKIFLPTDPSEPIALVVIRSFGHRAERSDYPRYSPALSKKYGDVFSLQICWQNMVVLNVFEVIKEALFQKSEDIADRLRFPLYEALGLTGNSKVQSWGCYLSRFHLDSPVFGRAVRVKPSCLDFQIRKSGQDIENNDMAISQSLIIHIISPIRPRHRSPPSLTSCAPPPACFLAPEKVATLEYTEPKETKRAASMKIIFFILQLSICTAGTETTTTTLRWALLYMLLYPEVQRKVQEEIDQIIGRNRKPAMLDVLNMPYTSDPQPVAQTEIQGYFIPKGMIVMINLSSVLKDERVWENPYQFYPEHFLDEEGKFVKKEAFVPFAAGRRSCLGEQLARMEMFLFFTTLLQTFIFLIPDNEPRPQADPVSALTLTPHSFNVCAKMR
ncbi:hypothetical protein XELAEV_18025672mg [Xenopus laevis]|uniref:Uncharacterized protein n=1 Tax=Xenopus laevis TaxID=8355 RepID=A0A974HMK3_XENLA|nr:hypothetical protein XELAEV_18025672mg [Xenopus laevis]